MMKPSLALLTTVLTSKGWGAPSAMVAQIHMKEGQVEYDQVEVFDPATSDVITHVPRHTRDNLTLHEVVKVENEALGLAVWRLLERDFCYIERMEPERDPIGMLLKAANYEVRDKVMDVAKMETIYILAKDLGEWKGDRKEFTKDMVNLCNGLQIRLVSNTNISKEEFERLTDGKDRRVMGLSASCCARRAIARIHSEEEMVHRIVVSV